MKTSFLMSIALFCFSATSFAQTVTWSGTVSADGTPTIPADLILHQQYQIRVSGVVNLGKWWQAGKPLAEDAYFEFNAPNGPRNLETLMNSIGISDSNIKYNPDHVYLSEPFIAKQNKIHFWINDEDYSDNTGSLNVEVIHLKQH